EDGADRGDAQTQEITDLRAGRGDESETAAAHIDALLTAGFRRGDGLDLQRHVDRVPDELTASIRTFVVANVLWCHLPGSVWSILVRTAQARPRGRARRESQHRSGQNAGRGSSARRPASAWPPERERCAPADPVILSGAKDREQAPSRHAILRPARAGRIHPSASCWGHVLVPSEEVGRVEPRLDRA